MHLKTNDGKIDNVIRVLKLSKKEMFNSMLMATSGDGKHEQWHFSNQWPKMEWNGWI